jgi:hypothetical protein
MLGFLCGQTIKLSRQQKTDDGKPLGEANPKEISRIMREKIEQMRAKISQ